MKSHRYQAPILVLVGTTLLAGCGSSGPQPKAAHPVVTGVAVEILRLRPTPEFYDASGTVQSATTSILGAQISGTVRAIYVRPGDRVRRGQVLALLDDRSVRAQLAAAQAGVEESSYGMTEVEQALEAAKAQSTLAGLTYHRYQALLAKNSVSPAEFDQANANYKAALADQAALEAKGKQVEAQRRQAQSEAAAARTVFSYSRIVSPINGVVTAKAVDAGSLVMPGAPILTVEDPLDYRLEVSLPEKFFSMAQVGKVIGVRLHDAEFQGRVIEVAPAADPASRTFLIKIALPENCGCSSGDYGKAEFPIGEENRLTVPGSALVERGELEGVFVVRPDGLVEYRLVRTGRTFGDRVEVLSGLAEGDRIATSETSRLSDGARLEEP
jgi:multidrug efflux system membrane fusion protein